MQDINKKIDAHWSNVTKKTSESKNLKLRWWQSPHIIKHINRVVCGEPIPGFSQGLINIVKARAGRSIPFMKGISVGGGNGQKEIDLIKQGIVEYFDIYELSQTRISVGRELAKKQLVADKVQFIYGDAFERAAEPEKYEFVHWNNSLHHMFDVDKALKWSKTVLKQGGLFYMDDFVGASRFQWPDEQLEVATKVRCAFQQSKYLSNPNAQTSFLPTDVTRPDKEKLVQSDPSEAADSDRIIDAIYQHFPNAEIKNTGGVIYHLALSDMLHNFNENDDKILLDLLMIIDELCTKLGQTHYAIALAFKDDCLVDG
ncbi:MAG: class I SAM-dependent methyltransferase [Elainellaceae cyanobacterium]